ncbi:hypothetical protein CQ047_04970 [Microbacterium sp. MYb72]|uniref:hypothetical protein n=1 Tax=Microbacterium sp. MYb72 TaxID=1848693 RepID=UPI000CFAF575|nr:hypothetical protein [Microbacterium sp. MYb72]PRB11197.1 hypothetical protein CQ047_04970 [Microbacterium sp. MYb72]
MILSHSILHATSLVRNDIRRDTSALWPAHTAVGAHDITVGGRSLVELARERRTPCVLIAPRSETARSVEEHLTTVIAAVTIRSEPRRWHGEVDVAVDCTLGAIASRVMHVELLSSPRSRVLRRVLIHPADGGTPMHARLPETTAPGDLIVFTCTGSVSPSQLVPRAAVSPTSEEEGGFSGCRKYGGAPAE